MEAPAAISGRAASAHHIILAEDPSLLKRDWPTQEPTSGPELNECGTYPALGEWRVCTGAVSISPIDEVSSRLPRPSVTHPKRVERGLKPGR